MDGASAITLVICTYNNAALLDRALACLARQNDPGRPWSVLVVDNNCTDETPAVVERHRAAGRIPGLARIVERRQGQAYARLCGLSQTHAEWLAFVDDDCFLAEDWVANALRFAAAHPDCGAFGGRNHLDWELPPSPLLLRYASFFAHQDHGTEPRILSEREQLVGAGLVIRRVALERSGWLENQLLGGRQGKALGSGDDEEIVMRLRQAGFTLGYMPACELRHCIPRHRISEAYLLELFYQFGVARSRLLRGVAHESRLLGACAVASRVGKWSWLSLVAWAKASLGLMPRNESRAYLNFLRGLLAAR